jgi:lipid-binding SYLF domain-containing protein
MLVLRILALTAVLAAAAPLQAAPDHQSLIDRATATVEDMRNDASFGNSTELLGRAKAVMIVPQLVKGGFMFGAEGGSGVLLARRDGAWSNPAFYTMGAASFGLQIGIESAELVMFVMTQRALDAWLKNEVKLGVNAGLTVLVVGTAAEAAATTNANVDVIAWARAKGAYAGISLAGSVIKPNKKAIAGYYGKGLAPEQILLKGQGAPKGNVASLKAALRDAAPAKKK